MGFWKNLYSQFSKTADMLSDGEPFWWRAGSSMVNADQTVAGEAVTEDSMMTSATCFACTKALGETIAGLPGIVYRDAVSKRTADPLSDAQELLADQPNPEMDAFTFWEIATSRLTNSGNFFAEIQRDNQDRPKHLWPIHPSRVQPMRDEKDGSLYWEIASDFSGTPQLSDPTWRRENLRYLSPHNMLNIVGFGSRNGIISPGMLPGSQEIAMDFATRRYGGGFFKSGGVPVGYVEHPGWIDNEPKRKTFREDMNNIKRMNPHEIGVLWQGAKYNQISISPEHAQFLESRKFTADAICKFYGVPPAIIGDYEFSKFATADAMIRAFVMITLRNLAVRIEKAVNRQILNVRGSDGRLSRAFSKNLIYQIAIDGLLRGDPKTQAESWKMYRDMGVAKTNEVREDIGLNPVDGPEGEYMIVQGGMARLDKIDEQGTRQNNANKQTETTSAKLPEFNREKLIDALSTQIEQPVQVRGFDPNEAIKSAMVKLASSAVARIDKITLTQIERWREQDPAVVATKLPDFWVKQRDRLAEALEPLSDLAADAGLPKSISEEYEKRWSALDNYAIFDTSKHPKLDTEEMINASLS